MGNEIQNGEILTTWKEIAAYLKSGVRTCLRWEAEDGLPVHRQEGAPKSRVHAYKHELDAWFKARLSNGTIKPEAESRPSGRRWVKFLLVPGLIVLVAGGIYFAMKPNKKEPEPPVQQPVSGVPQSNGPFQLLAGDIIESETAPAGILRVWREKGNGAYFETWRIEPVRHTSLAVGNVDDTPGREVVAPGHCREIFEQNGSSATRIRFFLNVYKYDFKDWWKTTFYSPDQCVLEKDNYGFTDIAIGNLDGRPGNEIVLVTAHGLSVYRFDTSSGRILRICTRSSFPDDARPLFRSLCLTDIDNDGMPEILATANEGEEGNVTENKGWLFVFEVKDERLEVSQVVSLNGLSSVHSLRAGDVVPGGPKEAVFPIYRKEKDLWYASVAGWNPTDGFVFDRLLDDVGSARNTPIFLDVGDLMPANPGDEIIVARYDPNELLSYSWAETRLAPGPKYALDHRLQISGVQIGSKSKDPRKQASVLISGSAQMEDQFGRFYLERVNFTDGFFPGWRRLGGDKGELPVTQATYAFNFHE
jgi:hypothetical protein